MLGIGSSVCVVMVSIVIIWIHRWKNPRCNGTLPPGSLGLPLIGETIHLLISTTHSLDLHSFFRKRILRYGPLFKTSMMGRRVVVTAEPEANHFILQQEGKLVEMCYLDSMAQLVGHDDSSSANATGHVHKYLRALIVNHFGYDKLKSKLLNKVEAMAHESLHSWSSQPCVELNRAISHIMFDFISKELFSYEPQPSTESMGDVFIDFLDSLASIPLNIPGTTFHKCLKNQKKTMKILMEIVEERCRGTPGIQHGDFLDYFLQDMKKEAFITKDFIAFVMFGLLFATFESIPTMMALALKFIMEHPLVLQQLKEEHGVILRNRNTSSNSTLTWKDYKSMTFTHHVIDETLRMANVGLGNFRKALEDIKLKGYTIPKGWTILVVSLVFHMDPSIYPDPLVFNPWRWQDEGCKILKTKNFTPFGGGIRYCPGAELSKMTMAIFLHVAVTKYRLTKIKGGHVVRNPILKFKDGFHVNVSEKMHEVMMEDGISAQELTFQKVILD